MICLADTSIVINCPVDTVFDYVIELSHFADWFPAVSVVTSGNELAKHQPGKVYWETVNAGFGKKQQIELRVVEVALNQRFVTEGQFPALLPRMEITFQASEAPYSTLIRWRMFSRRNRGLGRFLLLPLARRIMSRRAPVGLQKLKSILENVGK